MDGLALMLRLTGRRVVIIGGGPVAVRRAAAMLDAGASVTVIAPSIDPLLADMGVECHERGYAGGDLDGATLAVIASDDPAVNERVAAEARAAGVLVNRVDDADAGDVQVMAHGRAGPITVAVHSGGVSAAAAAMIRDELMLSLDPAWRTLLETAAPFRSMIQQRVQQPDERRRRLIALTSAEAMATLKQQGVEALRMRCEALVAAHEPTPTTNPRHLVPHPR